MRLKEIKPGMVIHCKTEEERFALINHIDNQGGFRWRYTGDSPAPKDFCMPYLVVGDDRKITQSPTDNVGINITEFSDLIIPELSAKEVLETMKEICRNVNGCVNCPLNGECNPATYLFDAEKTVDACTKWRDEHPKEDKKKLETEWVDVIRIIKIHDNGKKECVHEAPILIEMSDLNKVAEAELKHYASEHKGNYFATLEHICRIKE